MPFDNELKFEAELVKFLKENCGWYGGVLKNPTEEDLIKNWAEIIYNNNNTIDCLNNKPLTEGEINQILSKINLLKSPFNINKFLLGKSITIRRDYPGEENKPATLILFDKNEVAGGHSVYQIAEQPIFKVPNEVYPGCRGDLMLLINGMPLYHIELKRSGVPISKATAQIERYMGENVYMGIYALVQIFVAMKPEEALYYANPGKDGIFNKNFYFHWADFNNIPINEWQSFARNLLYIPLAHQMIGYYSVADGTDGIFKVMRSYQYYAASNISKVVHESNWTRDDILGGYVWHTTGSGKTLTSFKSAQLIAESGDADKVVFLMDRIELGTQSLDDYKGFAEDSDSVQSTENTATLKAKLKSEDKDKVLIVTSIQKMSRITEDNVLNIRELREMQAKRIVFVIDECHRSTFGEMLQNIKLNFPNAIFFGFTGTPIQEENSKKLSTTSSVFGRELHRYSIRDGISDKNVLGFDPDMVITQNEKQLKTEIAIEKCHASNIDEVMEDPKKQEMFYEWINKPMDEIEKQVPTSQYETEMHREKIVEYIVNNWKVLSRNSKFHAILATSHIWEAIEYYKLLKDSSIKVTAVFNEETDDIEKINGLAEIINDYNIRYNQTYTIPTFKKFKKDVCLRLAHKKPYQTITNNPEEQVDLVIVVDQLLTGFDSKWINTLYLDKVLRYEEVIQAFSRTNRLFGKEKPFGNIKYFRYPRTMKNNIDNAVRLYSGSQPLALFVNKRHDNLVQVNARYAEIEKLFENAGIKNFISLPNDEISKKRFAKLFNEMNEYLEAAKVQGFYWGSLHYSQNNEDGTVKEISLLFEERTYKILLMRYKELFGGHGGPGVKDLPYDVDGNLIENDTGDIDDNYMNSNFKKYIKELDNGDSKSRDKALDELHSSFASLTQDEQRIANIILQDILNGDLKIASTKTLKDYIVEYQCKEKDDQIHKLSTRTGLDEEKLRRIVNRKPSNKTINDYGEYDSLFETADVIKVTAFYERRGETGISTKDAMQKFDILLYDFIIQGGFNIS